MKRLTDPKEVMASVSARYATCRSYSDVGFIHNLGEPNSRCDFKTWFIRPDKFRFEWTSYHPYFGRKGEQNHYMLWSDGRGCYSRYHFNNYEVEPEESLLLAVAGATGISDGTVRTAFSLLLPVMPEGSSELLTLNNQTLWSSTSIMGERCYHVEGISTSGEEVDLWISKQEFALRKIKEHVLITAKFMREVDRDLKERDPELYKETGPRKTPYKDWHFVTECKYTSVQFDTKIDKRIFSPTFER
ncbi:MAG: hypothetical protein K2Z81_21970 [Cyanobacteria bacterium]|nr:hypothetical protein [Cyanobacteriota bacterium]